MNISDKLRAGITTASAAETQALAAEFAHFLPPNATLALHGDLGVGKTTFVQGLARGFGIASSVTSPTFNLYALHHSPTRLLVHLDAYRIDNARQIEDLLLEDFLVPPWCLAIEWPEKLGRWLPSHALHLTFAITPDERHTIKLTDGG